MNEWTRNLRKPLVKRVDTLAELAKAIPQSFTHFSKCSAGFPPALPPNSKARNAWTGTSALMVVHQFLMQRKSGGIKKSCAFHENPAG